MIGVDSGVGDSFTIGIKRGSIIGIGVGEIVGMRIVISDSIIAMIFPKNLIGII